MIYRGPISDQTWDSIRAEYTLAALEQVRGRLSELMDDPEPVMRQLVRVFIGEGPFCPGFQFLPGRAAPPHGHRACPARDGAENHHNYFTLWMITPSRRLAGSRPFDLLDSGSSPLLRALDTLGRR